MRTGKQRNHANRHLIRTAALVLTGILLLLAVVASFLPLIETNVWWVRSFDFPRVQFTVALLVLVAFLIVFGGLRRLSTVLALVLGWSLWATKPIASILTACWWNPWR